MRTPLGSAHLDAAHAARDWKAALTAGIVLIVLGLAAILFPFVAALATGLVVGGVLLLAGIFEAIAGLRRHAGASGRFWLVMTGVIAIIAGVLLLAFPLVGVFSLAFVVGVFFIAQGVARAVYAWHHWQADGAGWWLAGSILAALLGVLILLLWPSIAPWVLGVLVGIDLLLSGWRNLALALAARSIAAR